MPEPSQPSGDDPMIALVDAAKESGIPLDTLRRAAQRKRIVAELRPTPRGPVWYTLQSEITRFKKTYHPHKPVKK